MSKLFAKSLIGTVVALAALSGAWAYKREDQCRRLLASLDAQSDVEVRRTSAGVCYSCRLDGPLYDLTYPYCAKADRIYQEGRETQPAGR